MTIQYGQKCHLTIYLFNLPLLLTKKSFLEQFLNSCSDPNNESDPSSEYSLLGLTHVMNHCLGQKFITWVKINCLDLSLKPGTGIPRPRTVDQSLYILLEMQHTQMGFHAFKMADKIARKEGCRQVFVEYVNEIADNSRTASFRFYEDSPLKY